MSDINVHTFFHILSEQQEVRILIKPIQLSMNLQDLAVILETVVSNLREYPSEATIAELKETMKDNDDL